jgi:hypothetical protein
MLYMMFRIALFTRAYDHELLRKVMLHALLWYSGFNILCNLITHYLLESLYTVEIDHPF